MYYEEWKWHFASSPVLYISLPEWCMPVYCFQIPIEKSLEISTQRQQRFLEALSQFFFCFYYIFFCMGFYRFFSLNFDKDLTFCATKFVPL